MEKIPKVEFRKYVRAIRDEISVANGSNKFGYQISINLLKSSQFANSRTIISFLPLPLEIDISYFNSRALHLGKKACFSVVFPDFKMQAYIPMVPNDFVVNKCKIRQPNTNASII